MSSDCVSVCLNGFCRYAWVLAFLISCVVVSPTFTQFHACMQVCIFECPYGCVSLCCVPVLFARVRMCSCVPVYASVDIVSRITVTDCMFYCVSAQQDGQFVRLHVCMVELPMTVCLYTRVDAGLYVCMPLCMCDSACCLVWL